MTRANPIDPTPADTTVQPVPRGRSTQPAARATWQADTRLVGGFALIAVGLLWSAERAGWLNVTATAVLATATLIVGIGLIVGSRHEEHPNLIALGFVLTLLTAATASASLEGLQGGVGDRSIAVVDPADLDTDYEQGVGSLVLDLRELELNEPVADLHLNVGVGELTVLLPTDTAIDVRARATIGEVTIPDRATGGLGVGVDERFQSTDFASSERRLTIEANVFIGSVEIEEWSP